MISMIKVVFWTGSGNTEEMANAVAEGITEAGQEAQVIDFDSISPDEVRKDTVIAFGCPAMGDEVLEESTVEPFMEEYESYAAGKTLGLFGSYGWGDGQWMRDWVERMEGCGACVLGGEDAIANEAPDDEAIEACKALGKSLAAEA